jgi:hypothetical protein
LSILGSLFGEGNFVLFLNQHKLESLVLKQNHLSSQEIFGAVAAAGLQDLHLYSCRFFEDRGVALFESVREGCYPKGLCLTTWGGGQLRQFESQERCNAFMNALRGNTHIELLGIYYRLLFALVVTSCKHYGYCFTSKMRDCPTSVSGYWQWFLERTEAVLKHLSLCTLVVLRSNRDSDQHASGRDPL